MTLARARREQARDRIRRIQSRHILSKASESLDYTVGSRVIRALSPEGALFLAELAAVGAFGAGSAAAVRAL